MTLVIYVERMMSRNTLGKCKVSLRTQRHPMDWLAGLFIPQSRCRGYTFAQRMGPEIRTPPTRTGLPDVTYRSL